MWLAAGYHLQVLKICSAQETTDQNLTLWLFDQLYVNQIYLTTFKISVPLRDAFFYYSYKNTFRMDKLIKWKRLKLRYI